MKKNATKVSGAKIKNRYKQYNENRRRPDEKPENFGKTAMRLLKWLKPYKWMMLLVGFSGIFSTALMTLGPMFLGDVVDEINEQVQAKLAGGSIEMGEIAKILLIIFAIFLVSSVLSYVQQYTMAGVTQKVVCSMREQINLKLSKMPLSYLDRQAKGEILSRIMNDIDNISQTLQNNVIQIVTSLITFFGVLALMLYVSWKMTLISFAVLPPSLVIAMIILKKSKKYFRRNWAVTGEINAHFEEMYTGHKIVRVFNHEATAIEEFDKINGDLYEVGYKAQFISGMIMPFINFVNNIGYVLICIVGGMYVIAGTMSLGDITVFITYSKLFMQPMIDLASIANRLQSSLASAERVFALLDGEEECCEGENNEIGELTGKIEFENVSFRYLDDSPLIEDMNLSVEPGQLIAIVGPTGAGKTTIVNLLMRFYDVCSGSIKVDGVDIKTIPREELRRRFGMVLQDTWLFEGTIRDNIAYGREDASEEMIFAAAQSARVNHFVNTLSDGYDTVLEEDGTNISQGQRQLLTIARAILADPPILILDEATSSVDTRTEIQIQQAMKTLMKGRTNFVIAHRLSTIRKADMILVMNHGKIVEQGKHEELLSANGFYAELYNSQFAGNKI